MTKLNELNKKYDSLKPGPTLRHDYATWVLDVVASYEAGEVSKDDLGSLGSYAMFGDEDDLHSADEIPQPDIDDMLRQLDDILCDLIDADFYDGGTDGAIADLKQVATDILDGYHYAQVGVDGGTYERIVGGKVVASASVRIYRTKDGIKVCQGNPTLLIAIEPITKAASSLYEVLGKLPDRVSDLTLSRKELVTTHPDRLDDDVLVC